MTDIDNKLNYYVRSHNIERKGVNRERVYTFYYGYLGEESYGYPHYPEHNIVIQWSCGDTVGPWEVEEFEQLLKNAAKGTKEYPFRKYIYSQGEDVLLWVEDDVIMWSTTYETDNLGPLLSEFRKDLRNVKARQKREQAADGSTAN